MYIIDDADMVKKIESYCRTWRVWLSCDNRYYMGGEIMDMQSDQQSTSLSDDIELGAVCAQSINIKVNGLHDFLGKSCRLYIYLADIIGGHNTTYNDLEKYTYSQLSLMTVKQISKLGEIIGELIPLGSFVCVKSKHIGNITEITLADKLYFSDKIYDFSNINFPTTGQTIENDICQKLGIENANSYSQNVKLRDKNNARLYDNNDKRLRVGTLDFPIKSIPERTTMRQMLSYIASAHGQFGYIDRFGNYVRKWYGNSVKTLDNNAIDAPTLSEKSNVVTGMSCKVSNSLNYKSGDKSGRYIEFENPYMTQSLFLSLSGRIVNRLEWYTAELYYRLGDPRLDVGDVLTYLNDNGDAYNILITSLGLTYDGGLSADIKSVGRNVEEQL